MKEEYDIEKLRQKIEERWAEKKKAFPISKLYEDFETKSHVEKMKINNDISDLERKRLVSVSQVPMIEVRLDTIEEKKRVEALKKGGVSEIPPLVLGEKNNATQKPKNGK